MTVAERPRWPPGVVRRRLPPPGPAPRREHPGAGCSRRRFSFAAGAPDPCSGGRASAPSGAAARPSATTSSPSAGAGSRPTTKRKRLTGMSRRHLVHAPQDLRPEVRQLVGPDGGGALHGELPAAEGLGPRTRGHRVAHGARPRRVGARFVPAGELVERRDDDVSQAAREVVPAPARGGALAPTPGPGRPGLPGARTRHRASSSGGAGGAVSSAGGAASPAASEPSSGSSTTVASASSSSVK